MSETGHESKGYLNQASADFGQRLEEIEHAIDNGKIEEVKFNIDGLMEDLIMFQSQSSNPKIEIPDLDARLDAIQTRLDSK